MSRPWNVAVLGATGAVGRVMLECLAASELPVGHLRLLASARAAGRSLRFDPRIDAGAGGEIAVTPVDEAAFDGIDLALFSAGADAARAWAPRAARAGAWVVDNSSCFRMDPAIPLIVPEVNPEAIGEVPGIVANPNCSTIQMVLALAPLARAFGLARVHVCTYQSASGKGEKGLRELRAQERSTGAEAVAFPRRLHGDVIPQCDVFLEDGYTREEEKMIEETRKILGLADLSVHPTCVRVPVEIGHSEAVYVETLDPAPLDRVRRLWSKTRGIAIADDPSRGVYPTARETAGTDPVWVGRLRRDRMHPCGLHFWVVADNLRKGAALNAVQIAELLWTRIATPR